MTQAPMRLSCLMGLVQHEVVGLHRDECRGLVLKLRMRRLSQTARRRKANRESAARVRQKRLQLVSQLEIQVRMVAATTILANPALKLFPAWSCPYPDQQSQGAGMSCEVADEQPLRKAQVWDRLMTTRCGSSKAYAQRTLLT